MTFCGSKSATHVCTYICLSATGSLVGGVPGNLHDACLESLLLLQHVQLSVNMYRYPIHIEEEACV